MSNNREYISPRWAGFSRLWKIVAIILFLLLALLWFLGYGPKLWLLGHGPNGNKCAVAPTVVEKIVEMPVEKIVNVEKLITAPDTVAPRLGIKGASIVKMMVGESYSDSGIIAIDNIDSKVDVKVTGKVDTKTPGKYMLTYTATDAAGNKSSETRTVIVEAAPKGDETAPRLSLIGSSIAKIPVGSTFVDAGATAMDSVDGEASVKVTGKVDANTPGTYTITYTSTDKAGNTSTVKRKVIVEPPLALAKLYFELDSAEFPADTELSLSTVIAYLRKNSSAKAVVSGFHDPSGNLAHNQELALNRAKAVRSLLEQSGITADRIELEKPESTTGTGAPEEARRVEVRATN
jgi:outer membrane protein OmpA-like peptidoglycan-associated protein